MSLLPVAQAQARLLALATPLPGETLPLDQCIGRWLTSDVAALRDQPFADLSAMDGYAIAHADLPGPWRVVSESTAGGIIPASLARHNSARIFTGAPLPQGADSILIQEDARREGDTLVATEAPPAGAHVRHRGSDFAQGALLLPIATFLGSTQLALAALGGHGSLPVRRRPRIALLSTGNELVSPGEPVPPGKLPSSNAIMLRALLAAMPCDVEDRGIVPDDLAIMTAAFDSARGADIILSTGGASVGDHDLVRPAFEAAGGTLDFWKIRMRPGKPLIAGHIDAALFLGLPGNPVSAFVTATLFLLPLIRHLSGCAKPLPVLATAPLAAGIAGTGPRDEYLRARRTAEGAIALTAQDSAATFALAQADCLIVRPADAPAAKAGEPVTILPLT